LTKSNKSKTKKSKRNANGNNSSSKIKRQMQNGDPSHAFNAEYKNVSFDEHHFQNMEQSHHYSNHPTEATGNHGDNFENEKTMKEMFREQMQLQLFGAGANGNSSGADMENKNYVLNSAFKEAF
jgi:hypothetical protein